MEESESISQCTNKDENIKALETLASNHNGVIEQAIPPNENIKDDLKNFGLEFNDGTAEENERTICPASNSETTISERISHETASLSSPVGIPCPSNPDTETVDVSLNDNKEGSLNDPMDSNLEAIDHHLPCTKEYHMDSSGNSNKIDGADNPEMLLESNCTSVDVGKPIDEVCSGFTAPETMDEPDKKAAIVDETVDYARKRFPDNIQLGVNAEEVSEQNDSSPNSATKSPENDQSSFSTLPPESLESSTEPKFIAKSSIESLTATELNFPDLSSTYVEPMEVDEDHEAIKDTNLESGQKAFACSENNEECDNNYACRRTDLALVLDADLNETGTKVKDSLHKVEENSSSLEKKGSVPGQINVKLSPESFVDIKETESESSRSNDNLPLECPNDSLTSENEVDEIQVTTLETTENQQFEPTDIFKDAVSLVNPTSSPSIDTELAQILDKDCLRDVTSEVTVSDSGSLGSAEVQVESESLAVENVSAKIADLDDGSNDVVSKIIEESIPQELSSSLSVPIDSEKGEFLVQPAEDKTESELDTLEGAERSISLAEKSHSSSSEGDETSHSPKAAAITDDQTDVVVETVDRDSALAVPAPDSNEQTKQTLSSETSLLMSTESEGEAVVDNSSVLSPVNISPKGADTQNDLMEVDSCEEIPKATIEPDEPFKDMSKPEETAESSTIEPFENVKEVDKLKESLEFSKENSTTETVVEDVDMPEKTAEVSKQHSTVEPAENVKEVDRPEKIAEVLMQHSTIEPAENVTEVDRPEETAEVSKQHSTIEPAVEDVDMPEETVEVSKQHSTVEPAENVKEVDRPEETAEVLMQHSTIEPAENVTEVDRPEETAEVSKQHSTVEPAENVKEVDRPAEVSKQHSTIEPAENVKEVDRPEETAEVSKQHSTIEPAENISQVDETAEVSNSTIERVENVMEVDLPEDTRQVSHENSKINPVSNSESDVEVLEVTKPKTGQPTVSIDISGEANQRLTVASAVVEKARINATPTAMMMTAAPSREDGSVTKNKRRITVTNPASAKRIEIDVPIEETRGRGRPKRTAARAADSKIKTLILRSLEPSTLEEVSEPITQKCAQCKRTKLCRYVVGNSSLCSETCHALFLQGQSEERSCQECRGPLSASVYFSWETMNFCKEECLAQYQVALGMNCVNCTKAVPQVSMGKYCVRFGNEIKQFCAPSCLEEHKKGLKVCSYCQKDISRAEGFLAPVGDKGQFKEFCTNECMTKYSRMSGTAEPNVAACAVCLEMKPVAIEVLQGAKLNTLCSEPCFAAFKFVNSVSEVPCQQCKKYFDKVNLDKINIYIDERLVTFCCKTCINVYVLANRKIMQCGCCKVKKYNFDMIKKTGLEGTAMMCSLTCLKSFEELSGSRRNTCDECGIYSIAEYKTPSVSGVVRHFCSYKCAMSYKDPKLPPKPASQSVDSSCGTQEKSLPSVTPPQPRIHQHIITKPREPVEARNKAILCKPYMHNKGTSCRPMPCQKSTQTDSSLNMQTLIPIPVPIYVPAPMHMYSAPYPVPVPFPLPIPVPIFIPTTRNSAKGILKEIKKIQEKIPNDPFEAELLMMAEMVAGEKKQDVTDSESDGDGNDAADAGDAGEPPESFSPEAVDSNAFGEDMLQMALKMASELDEPAVDMESVLTSNTITPSAQPSVDNKALYAAVPEETAHTMAIMRGRKRVMRGGRGGNTPSKRSRRTSGPSENTVMPSMGSMAAAEIVQPQRIEVEKPDANMRLKYTFGVNAWRHWVMQKNLELEKAMITNRKIKPFKPDLLQLTADELNFSLCLFVKEVKKPNGQEYAPDTIYYLCLGIQQYLFENGRIDNIFTDTYYEKFTDCLDEVAKKFAVIYNDSQYIVTRVEEEHLWESKQLGAHSPHVLLSTLMFFNTKHFNLVTVEEHMQLSFSHIMKHWKRNPNAPGVAKIPGSRNVLLRFYPPQSALEANSRKKKVYEQQENEENPLRCPVKLYEFYLSKCPESVKTRNDVFYLLPERSCVPDSPVWYSTMALGKEPLMKMLHRVKMVKEINVALLTS